MTITHILKPCYSKLDSLYFITESEDDGGEDNKGVALLASVFESSAFLTTKKEVFDFITIVIKATEDPVNKGGLLGGGRTERLFMAMEMMSFYIILIWKN